jgi:uncharacterized protein YdeI (YjbR/CyaY-like superfamily)
MPPELPEHEFADRAAFAEWLAANAETSGLWLRIAKKGTGIPSVDHDEALTEALRHGWIDGTVRRVDERYFAQKFVPRARRSRWSAKNCRAAEKLIAEGRMFPRGLAEVTAAKADGRWDKAYEGPANARVPDDLAAALAANPRAAAFFATLTSQNRYAILYRVEEAKRAETRARRIATFVGMLERGETLH